MSGIIADKHHRNVFDNIIQEGLDAVIKNGEVNFLSLTLN